MAFVVKDRVQEITTTVGTGTVALGGAVLGFQTFAIIGDGNTTYYAIADPTTGEWEVGIGTYTASGTTLSRTTVLESSNSGSLVAFAAGTKNVFCTYPAERAVYLDAAGSAVTLLDIGTLGASTANITTANITSGTITTTPVNNTDIVNKAYADAIASGIHFHEAVGYATTAALPACTYNNGTSGVGATLTGDSNGALTIDGHTFTSPTDDGTRVLIKNQANGAHNGVYTLSQAGNSSPGAPFILTRSTDMDTVGTGVDQIDEGDFFLVTSGTANVNTAWVQQTAPPITIGTTAIVFQQFSAPITYTAGTGLSESPSYTFNIANTGTAGTYGSASSVPVFVTNAQGQVTSVTNTGIAISSGAVSGLAASATTDTTNASNITTGTLGTSRLSGSYTGVTGVGTLTAGTWNATAIGAVYGGTGLTSYAVGDLLYADTTTSLAKLADVAVGNALISGGVAAAPSWGKIGLATHVSGTLPVANGGTGVTSSTGTGSTVLSTNPSLAGATMTGTLLFDNATSPNTQTIQFGDNTGWNLRMMTSVSGTPTTRFTFGDNGNFTAVGTVTATNHIGAGTGLTGTASGLSIGGNAATATTATNQSGGTVSATTGSFSGVLTAPKHLVNRSAGQASGIAWYDSSYSAWTDYMSPAAATSCGPYGNITAPSGTLVTSWGLRRFIENASGYGWTWESGTSNQVTPTVVAEIRASDGAARFAGTVTAPTFSGSLSGSASNNLLLSGGTMTGTITNSASSLVIGTSGGVQRGYLYNDSSGFGLLTNVGSWAARVDFGTANVSFAGAIKRQSAGIGYLNGDYGSVEGVSTTGVIYSIGGIYVPTSTSYNNMYGVAYAYSGPGRPMGNVAGIPSDQWAFVGLEAGTPKWALCTSNGSAYFSGSVNATSIFDNGSRVLSQAGSTYYQVNTWLQFNGNYGLYWPAVFGCHFDPNNSSTYTQFQFRGSKNSYSGYYDVYSAVNQCMYDSGGNGGVYREANGRWYFYYSIGNACMGVGTSSTSASYGIYVIKGVYSEGNVVAYSDERVKTNWRDYPANFVEQLAKLKHGTYDRTDIELTQDGVSAQSLQTLLPYSAPEDENGNLAVNYGGAALVSAVELAKRVIEQDERIAALEAIVAKLS